MERYRVRYILVRKRGVLKGRKVEEKYPIERDKDAPKACRLFMFMGCILLAGAKIGQFAPRMQVEERLFLKNVDVA